MWIFNREWIVDLEEKESFASYLLAEYIAKIKLNIVSHSVHITCNKV